MTTSSSDLVLTVFATGLSAGKQKLSRTYGGLDPKA
jgi:hypothetical protein